MTVLHRSIRRPDVTVVITTRNRRSMLAEAVASVQNQMGVNWELFVIDDDSTDGTLAFLETLIDSRIQVRQALAFGFPRNGVPDDAGFS